MIMQSILDGQPRIAVKTANWYLTVDGEVAVFQSEDQMRCYLNRLRMHHVRVRRVALCYSIGRCKKCGSPLFQSDLPESGYESQCFTCDEDFYRFEQNCEHFDDKED